METNILTQTFNPNYDKKKNKTENTLKDGTYDFTALLTVLGFDYSVELQFLDLNR